MREIIEMEKRAEKKKRKNVKNKEKKYLLKKMSRKKDIKI